jgi:PAS domain-containing protein
LLFVGLTFGLIVVSALLRQHDLEQIDRQTRELAESNERFRRLFEYSPDAVLLIDPHDPSTAGRNSLTGM